MSIGSKEGILAQDRVVDQVEQRKDTRRFKDINKHFHSNSFFSMMFQDLPKLFGTDLFFFGEERHHILIIIIKIPLHGQIHKAFRVRLFTNLGESTDAFFPKATCDT